MSRAMGKVQSQIKSVDDLKTCFSNMQHAFSFAYDHAFTLGYFATIQLLPRLPPGLPQARLISALMSASFGLFFLQIS